MMTHVLLPHHRRLIPANMHTNLLLSGGLASTAAAAAAAAASASLNGSSSHNGSSNGNGTHSPSGASLAAPADGGNGTGLVVRNRTPLRPPVDHVFGWVGRLGGDG